ncbi:MAG TPA: VWA domain-containing protein [Vicinamibacterales bacterium]|nr:VWA domain-containing protein [Vicinamibacterales bacterium]
MIYVFAAFAAALVVIYMARPNFRRAVLSAALFFRDDPVLGSTSRIAWSTPRATPLFFLQMAVLLLLLFAVPHGPAAAVMERSSKTGVRVLVDRSASMTTRLDGSTRADAAVAALRSVAAPQQSAIACFTLSAFDLELVTIAENVTSLGDLLDLVSAIEPRPLGTELSLVQRALASTGASAKEEGLPSVASAKEEGLPSGASAKEEGLPSIASAKEGCATGATIVVTDMPAPPWMDGPDGPASRGDVWIDVSQPAANAGIVDVVDDRDRVSGEVRGVRVVVGAFGDIAASNVTLDVRSPDGAVRTHRVETWDGPNGSLDVKLPLPGRYAFRITPAGAYRYDDEAEIDVPRSGPVRVDWRVGRREWLTRLGWTADRDDPELRVVPTIEMLDSRPAIVLGSGYEPRRGSAQPITTFLETSPLVAGLNLDVAEQSGMKGTPSLPPGFNPVLSGPEGAIWIAERATPVAAYVPGLPLDGDDNVARFSSTVFLNAARWILERRPRPPLFTLTSPEQPEPAGTRIALHPGEGHTARMPRSVGTFDPRAPREQQTERRLPLWPWLVGAAALVFLAERGLALVRGAQ